MQYVRDNIAQMGGYISGEQPQSGDFIKLNTNENPYPASERVREAIAKAAHTLNLYPNAMGTPFRKAAAEVLGVDPSWIMCGNGSDDILTIVTRALVGEQNKLRLPYPSYILYKSLAELQGAQWEEVDYSSDWKITDAFSRPDGNVKLFFLPNPNSPTGTTVSPDELLALADKLSCPLLIDEAYADFNEFNCLDLVKARPNIMVSRTFSKSYALAGLRFGFLVARPELIEQFVKVKDSYNCDALSIAAASAAIQDQDWLRQTVAKIKATRTRLTDKMRALGFTVPDSSANFTWNVYPGKPLKPIYEYLKERNIFVRYMVYDRWGEGLRISVGTDEQIDKCVATIAEAMKNA
ncbi:MAG: histidinol-phosphate transaminase [Thermoguttaceae bacterium]|nr:histidinol-phosphate transaminase [Thermoguttaceae bacterium]